MLIIKSKYKIAKRLGGGIFEQTQSQKFALSEARSKAVKRPRGRGGSDYGKQLLEKQRVRYSYGLSEKQLSNYANAAIKEKDPALALHLALEMRADNVAYRAGFASTRRAARQMVSHGHLTVNGRRITTPSYRLRKGDVVAVREGKSRTSPLFTSLAEVKEGGGRAAPGWVAPDMNLLRAEIKGEPLYNQAEIGLDYATVFEFYSR
jgi:small subunit ribosomal protein S4